MPCLEIRLIDVSRMGVGDNKTSPFFVSVEIQSRLDGGIDQPFVVDPIGSISFYKKYKSLHFLLLFLLID